MWSSNAILGGQLEGGLANVRVNMTSLGAGISNTIGTGGFASSSTLSNSVATDTLDNRWQLSALARIGVLLDPVDLIYVIGGYTYSRFDYLNNFTFGMNGATIGGGWERQIVRGWTVRVEGRYTKFASKEVATYTSNTSSSVTSAPFGTTTFTALTASTDRFSTSMGSVLIGLSHYYNTY
jgi:opacity protein-like surface antigen